MRRGAAVWTAYAFAAATVACGRSTTPAPTAQSLLLITIDTLRADHVGAYGYTRSQAAFVDRMAASGAVFEHAYAAAPITLPSHATILTGRYPAGHGSRDNGMRVSTTVPTLATELKAQGFKTAAFVAAFPLDHQFGLDRGFDVYSDRLPRDRDGRLSNERPAKAVVDEALAWIAANNGGRFFVWVHVFEPHAPYGTPLDGRSAIERYDEDIGIANRELVRLIDPIASRAGTLTIVAGDHGESFGEHGEFAHSIFVYDTTLRVPLVFSGPGIAPAARDGIAAPVTLADIAPTAMRLLGFGMKEVDGIDLSPALAGRPLGSREIYAESFAPLIEFGWAPFRSVRSGSWKYIAAPTPELYDVANDPDERTNRHQEQADVARGLDARVNRYSADSLPTLGPTAPAETRDRLRALGYAAGSSAGGPSPGGPRPDAKDRREQAARIAQVTSGELSGDALIAALEGLARDDPRNGQVHLRLGYARLQSGDCARAEPAFRAAIASGLPSADAYLGLAGCLGGRRDFAGAERALTEARRLEPDNPAIIANLGILKGSLGDAAGAIDLLQKALTADPDLHEARFNLALTYARAGRRDDAAAAARDLLTRLPLNAPQRPEVERLIKAIDRQ